MADVYRAVFEMGPEPAVLIDADTARIVDANAATLRMLELARGDVVGRALVELLPSFDERLVAELAAFAANPPGERLVRRLTGFGPMRLVEIHVSLVDLVDRRLVQVIGHDVTERLAMERRSERVARLGSSLMDLDAHLADAQTESQVWRMSAKELVDPGGMSLAALGLVEVNRRHIAMQAVDAIPALAALGPTVVEDFLEPPDQQIQACLESGEPRRYRIEERESDLMNRAVEILGELDVALVPIRVGRFTVGIVVCVAPERDSMGLPELSMLKQISRRVAVRIGELERSERELQLAEALLTERERSARFASAMATIDREIARLASPTAIYQALSRLPVELGIGFAASTGVIVPGRPGPQLRIVASAGGTVGLEEHLADIVRMSLEGSPPAQLTETIVVEDVLADGRFRRRWSDLERVGVRSLAAIPLRIGPVIVGRLDYYAHEPAAFGAEQVALLERVAANAGNRLGVIRADERRWQAEKKLARMEAIPPSNAGAAPGPEE